MSQSYLISSGFFCSTYLSLINSNVSELDSSPESMTKNIDLNDKTLNKSLVATFVNNILLYGYSFDQISLNILSTLSDKNLTDFYYEFMLELKVLSDDKMIQGAHVFYKNFPQEVLDLESSELFLNSILYYWFGIENTKTSKTRLPMFEVLPKPKLIKLVSNSKVFEIATKLMNSSVALQQVQSDWLIQRLADDQWLVDSVAKVEFNNREVKAVVIGNLLKLNKISFKNALTKCDTPRDILKVLAVRAGATSTLTEKFKFGKLSRPEIKAILQNLQLCKNVEEDMLRDSFLWRHFYKTFPVKQYTAKFVNAKSGFDVVHDNKKHQTFNSYVQQLLENPGEENLRLLITTLSSRPSEFATRLDWILRSYSDYNVEEVLTAFAKVATNCSLSVLLRGLKFYSGEEQLFKLFTPKSKEAKSFTREQYKSNPTSEELRIKALHTFDKAIEMKFKQNFNFNPENKIFIDPALKQYAVPQVLRNLSHAIRPIARNSRIKVNMDKTIRLFIFWHEGMMNNGYESGRVDIDHSVSFVDSDWNTHDIWYGDQKSQFARQSGDITSAPHGAAEYTDIDIQMAKSLGYKYAIFTTNIYTNSGNKDQTFSNLSKAKFGWMERENVDSGELFEPASVIQSIELTGDTAYAVPAVLDMTKDQAEIIWVDLSKPSQFNIQNNIKEGKPGLLLTLKGIIESKEFTLFDYFTYWAKANGSIVGSENDATIIFSEDDEKSFVSKHDFVTITSPDYMC